MAVPPSIVEGTVTVPVPAVIAEAARAPIMTPERAVSILMLSVAATAYGHYVVGLQDEGNAFVALLLVMQYLNEIFNRE